MLPDLVTNGSTGIMLLAQQSGPSILQTGEPEAVAMTPIVLFVVTAAAFATLLIYWLRHRIPPARRAFEKLARAHRVDSATRRSLERCASQFELKSPAGLLVSPTALASAISTASNLSEKDRKRLRSLVERLAADSAKRD